MRGRLYVTTALVTLDGPLEPPGGDRAVAVPDALPQVARPLVATRFNDRCLCSDGEIYLQDENHLEHLLRGPA